MKAVLKEIINSYAFLLFTASLPFLIMLLKKKFKLIIFFSGLYISTFLLASLIKEVTAIPRPFIGQPQVLGIETNVPPGFSYPSIHVALATLAAWALSTALPRYSWTGFGYTLIVALSRVYLGVHYYTDVVAGFFLATGLFWIAYILGNSDNVLGKKALPNLRRKLIHLFYGLSLVSLLEYGYLKSWELGIITTLIGFFILLSKHFPKIVRESVIYFERNKKAKYLGLGPFFFTLSAFATTAIFPGPIAIVAILNLAIGDSFNALIGHFFKKKGNIQEKRFSAALAATLATIIVALRYVGPDKAIVGAVATMILEYSNPSIRGKRIDDNLLVPLVSGTAMLLI